MTIRQAECKDYDRFIFDLDAWWGGRNMAAMLPRLFFTQFGPWTYVAELEGDAVGFLCAFRSQTAPEQVYCHFIGVAPDARMRGIGEALYQRLFHDATARGCREILAVTSVSNRASVAFHERLGFQAMPGTEELFGTPFSPGYDGPGEDRVRFRKDVAEPVTNSLSPIV